MRRASRVGPVSVVGLRNGGPGRDRAADHFRPSNSLSIWAYILSRVARNVSVKSSPTVTLRCKAIALALPARSRASLTVASSRSDFGRPFGFAICLGSKVVSTKTSGHEDRQCNGKVDSIATTLYYTLETAIATATKEFFVTIIDAVPNKAYHWLSARNTPNPEPPMSSITAVSSLSPVRPIAPAREPATGRFTPASRLWAIAPVVLPNGRMGWRVGPQGKIFADPKAAERFAARRLGRSIKV